MSIFYKYNTKDTYVLPCLLSLVYYHMLFDVNFGIQFSVLSITLLINELYSSFFLIICFKLVLKPHFNFL